MRVYQYRLTHMTCCRRSSCQSQPDMHTSSRAAYSVDYQRYTILLGKIRFFSLSPTAVSHGIRPSRTGPHVRTAPTQVCTHKHPSTVLDSGLGGTRWCPVPMCSPLTGGVVDFHDHPLRDQKRIGRPREDPVAEKYSGANWQFWKPCFSFLSFYPQATADLAGF